MNKNFIIKGTVLKKYIGEDKDVVIPEGITTIAKNAFSDDYVHSITMPSSVTKLSYSAIDNCSKLEKVVLSENISEIISNFNLCFNLKRIEFPKDLIKIKDSFFHCTELEEIYLSKSVKKIDNSFLFCRALKRINIDKNNPYFSFDKKCLYNKTKDKLIRCFSFYDTKDFFIPDTVTEINAYAFECCNIKTIFMNDNVKKIGAGAFADCSIRKIRLSENISVLAENLFFRCENLKELQIPKKVKRIKRGALYCGIKTLVLPSLTTLDAAFLGINKLENLELQKGGNYKIKDNCIFTKKEDKLIMALPTFKYESYTIPDSVEELSEFAFSQINSLKKIIINHNIKTINEYIFKGCKNLTEVILPENIAKLPDGMFLGCKKLKSINLPRELKKIGYSAFCECKSLKTIKLPLSVTHIGIEAFYSSGIEEIDLNMVEHLAESAFDGCQSLKKIAVNENNLFYTAKNGCVYTKEKNELLLYAKNRPQKS